VLPFEDRYTRQRQVREVGLSGHTRIAALDSRLPDTAAGKVAIIYLERAGATQARLDASVVAQPFPYQAQFTSPSTPNAPSAPMTPSALAEGCYLALREMRRALGVLSG
jgi:hypothetical protein